MSAPLELRTRTFPSRIADLGFSADLPVGWTEHQIPAEQPDFSDPTLFFPLAVVAAPHAAIIYAVAARPAYDDGTLHDWTWYHLNNNPFKPRTVGEGAVAGVPAMVGEAAQDSDMGVMVTRFAFFEDGGRLINLTLTMPELMAGAMYEAWTAFLASFRLESPKGSRFGAAPRGDDVPEVRIQASKASSLPGVVEMRIPAHVKPRKSKFHDFALAEDAASLDPEHSINANLRDRGVGLVPEVAAERREARYAIVPVGAIMAQISVPFGWHVIDDGRRVLVFEPSGRVQIHLDLITRAGRDNTALLDAIEAQARADYRDPQCVRVSEGGVDALGIRGIADGSQAIEQYHLLAPFRDDTMALRARVTATPEEATDACNLAHLIIDSCAFDCFQQRDEPRESRDGRPEWSRRARELEMRGQLDAAERAIREGCQHIGFAASTAEMYRERMLRLMAAGDEAGARDAFQRADSFITYYASLATSGGEGAALSLERDQFRARLVAEFGSDPLTTSR